MSNRQQGDMFRIRGVPARMQAVLDRMHEESPDRWVPRRAIVANWWLFEQQEEILFGHGNLMLTGKNESGKTTLLVALITLVLDRMTAPYRIDTTGDAVRAVRYYLVGQENAKEDHPFYHHERTGYVALEFQHGRTGEHRTIGIGLRTSRAWANAKVVPWSFVIRDSRRIGFDFDLINSSTSRPLSRSELRDVLGDSGQVFDEKQQEQYQVAVNEALFGFPDLADFHRYLEILHVVRRPKLGEGLTPERVADLLVNSLPLIDTKPIDNASESFKRIDTIEAEIRRMEEQRQVADDLEALQVAAVKANAAADAHRYQQALSEERQTNRALQVQEAKLWKALDSMKDLSDEESRLRTEDARLEGRLEPLTEEFENHAAFDAKERLEGAEAEHRRMVEELQNLQDDRQAASAQRTEMRKEHEATQRSWDAHIRDVQASITEIGNHARAAQWSSLATRCANAIASLLQIPLQCDDVPGEDLAISTVEHELDQRETVIAHLMEAHRVVDEAVRGHRDLEASARRARAEHTAADERHAVAAQELEVTRAAAQDELSNWRDGLQETRITADAIDAVREAIATIEDANAGSLSLLAPFRSLHEEQREALGEEREVVVAQIASARNRAEEIEYRIRDLEQQKDAIPPRSPEAQRAREELVRAGIRHVPLYAAIDLRDGALSDAEAAGLERALESAGILDALIVEPDDAPEVERILGDLGLGDRWIRPDGNFQPHSWLVPAEGTPLRISAIQAALGRLCSTDNGAALSTSGRWENGAIQGLAAASEERVRYIGEANRRRERERRLAAAREDLAAIRTRIAEFTEMRDDVSRRLRTLEAEWEAVRALRGLRAIPQGIVLRDETARERDRKRAALEAALDSERAARERMEAARETLEREMAQAGFAQRLTIEDVRRIGADLTVLRKEAGYLVRTMGRTTEIRARARRVEEQAEAARARYDALEPRIAEKARHVTELKARIDHLVQRLEQESVGLEEIRAEIDQIRARRNEIDTRLREIGTERGKAEGAVETLEPQIETVRAQVHTLTEVTARAEAALAARLRSYPAFEGLVMDGEDHGWILVAEQLTAEISKEEAVRRASEAQNELASAFHMHREIFAGLSPQLDPSEGLIRFSPPEGSQFICELLHSLEADLAIKSLARDEKDREIIEKVFLRDITEAIRKTIEETREWIRHTSDILEGMNLFGDRVLRLRWQVRQRNEADSYDPQRLSELFQRKGIALHEAQQEELVEIFRDMIHQARNRAEEEGKTVDYREALLEMLDYREWYRLMIERREHGGEFQPLTRKRYGEGSIGRRTLDLILPLIAAVYARLGAATPSAPRLIGFDEAFAGVDELNSTQIYGLLDRLGLCWIMATEKATNYGAHIRGAVAYEFINDGQDVAPSASLWDGRVRHSFEQEELEIERHFILEEIPDA